MLTRVRVAVRREAADGVRVRVPGALEWSPWSRRTADGELVTAQPFRVDLDGVTDPVIDVEPLPLGMPWRVLERFTTGASAPRAVLVPEPPADPSGESDVDYADLIEVDPATLDPVGPPPVDVWTQALSTATAEATTDAQTAAAQAQAAADQVAQSLTVALDTDGVPYVNLGA